jgi:hypothetical protein
MSFTMILGVLVIAGIVGQVIGLINGLGVRSKAGRDLMSTTNNFVKNNQLVKVGTGVQWPNTAPSYAFQTNPLARCCLVFLLSCLQVKEPVFNAVEFMNNMKFKHIYANPSFQAAPLFLQVR